MTLLVQGIKLTGAQLVILRQGNSRNFVQHFNLRNPISPLQLSASQQDIAKAHMIVRLPV